MPGRLGLRVGIALLLLFMTMVGLRVHGFSLAQWHAVIDGSEPDEVVVGKPRYIRADDWLVQLPLAFAQRAHDPPFPIVNENISGGMNTLLPIMSPVAHPVTLFRPTQWGFFLGADTGMAWLWWSQVLGLVGVVFGISWTLARGQLGLALASAAFVYAAPFLQLFSFTKAAIPIHLGVVLLATLQVLSARSRIAIAGGSLAVAYAGVAFVVMLYPPFQVPLVYLVAVLLVGWMLVERQAAPWRTDLGIRLAALGLAGVLAVGIVLALGLSAEDAIARMLGTAYPGQRVSTGADFASWRLLTAHMGAALQARDFSGLINVVDASSFVVCFPLVGAGLLLRREWDPIALGLLGFCVAIVFYQVVGIPEWLARATLFSFVPGKRALLALGLADALLLLRYLALAEQAAPDARRIDPTFAAGVVGLWMIVLFRGGLELRLHLPELVIGGIVLGTLVNGAFAWAILQRLRPALTLALAALAVGATSLFFNPIARGGADYLRENPLSERVLAIDREAGGDTTWVVFGSSDLPNLLRTLGVRQLGGVNPLPPLELWRRIDPEGAYEQVYNRYAHVGFRLGPRGARPAFELSSFHGFRVYVDPLGPALRELGATHLIVRRRGATEAVWSAFAPLAEVGEYSIFALPLTRAAIEVPYVSPQSR